MFEDKDLALFAAKGKSVEQVESQLENFRNGFPYLELKKEVNVRYEQDLRLLTAQPKVVQISSGAEVKCEFNSAVGQVIGNVEMLTTQP